MTFLHRFFYNRFFVDPDILNPIGAQLAAIVAAVPAPVDHDALKDLGVLSFSARGNLITATIQVDGRKVLALFEEDGDLITQFPTRGNGRLRSSNDDDILVAGDRNDNIRGGRGDDFISGGDGKDRLRGDDGEDTLFGGNGNDYLNGGRDDDSLFGEDGNRQADRGPRRRSARRRRR